MAVRLGASCAVSSAQAPSQAVPVEAHAMIVPLPADGATDIVGRLIAQKLTQSWGQQVIVNHCGSMTRFAVAATSPPDGGRLLVGTSITHTVAPSL